MGLNRYSSVYKLRLLLPWSASASVASSFVPNSTPFSLFISPCDPPLRRRETVSPPPSSSSSPDSALHSGTIVRALAQSLGVVTGIRYRTILLTHIYSHNPYLRSLSILHHDWCLQSNVDLATIYKTTGRSHKLSVRPGR